MAKTLGIGVIGCGNISKAYFSLAPLFRGITMRACADINPDAAAARAKQFGLRAETVDGLLAAKDVDIIVNLTIPAAHYGVSKQILDAGKHVYSEKPFVLSVKDGLDLKKRADKKGLRVGSAPDTFLGGAHQLVRNLIDTGKLGKITSGTCHVQSHGMEHWHPNPDFFFQPGGGPILDLGPYYISNLVQLIGPVKRVAALGSAPQKERTIANGPRNGEKVPVLTPTTIHALLEFANGAVITFNASWDVWQHGHAPMELYGEAGTVHVPDPNFFGGTVNYTKGAKPVAKAPAWDHPFSKPNDSHPGGMRANYRTAGLADMAQAILAGRPHRCSLELALHAVDVMTGILKSAGTGKFVDMQPTLQRVLFPAFSAIQSETNRLQQSVMRSGRLLAAIIIPVGVGLSAVSEELVPVIYGDKWLAMIPVLNLFGLGSAYRGSTAIASPLFNSQNRVSLALKYNTIGTVLMVFGVLITLPYGIVAVSTAVALSSLYSLVTFRVGLGLIGLTTHHALGILGLPSIAAAVMWGAVYLLRPFSKLWVPNLALLLIVHIGFGAAIYVFTLHGLSKQYFRDFCEVAKKILPKP